MPLQQLIAGSLAGQEIAGRIAESLTPAQYAEPSALPGWTRAHVVAHLVGNALAMTRQVEQAKAGNRIEVYTGGQQGRQADIERRASDPDALPGMLAEAHRAWERAAAQIDERLAGAPVAYREGTVEDVIRGRWMESMVHSVDLAAGYRSREWPADFCAPLLRYLSERFPAGQSLRIEADDASYDETFGSGELVHLRGPLAAIAGFLADRGPSDEIASLAADLGQLGPYPRGSVQRAPESPDDGRAS